MAGNRNYSVGYEFNAKDGGFQRVMGSMSSSMDKLKKQVSLLGFNAALDIANKVMSATRGIANLTIESAKLAAQAEGVSAAFAKIGNERFLNDLKEATRGAVSDLSLMKAAVQASNFKIPLETLATFLKFAGDRALQTGEDFDFLVESIVKGLGRKSVLILDNLGLSVSEINEEVKKTGDFMTGAAAVIEREMTKAGTVFDTTTTKIARTQVAVENLKLAWGQYINQSKVAEGFLTDITTRLEMFANKDLSFWEKMVGTPNEYRAWKKAFDDAQNIIPKLSSMTVGWKSPFIIPTKEAAETKEVIEKELDLISKLKEFNSYSSLGYKGIGYGGKEGASTDNLKFKAPKWSMGTPGLQSYGGMSPETIKDILENNKIEEQMQKINGVIGDLNNSFTNLFYNVGNGWKGMIDSMLNSFRMLVAQIAAKAVVFAILNALSGGTGGLAKAAGGIVGGGFKSFMGFANGTNFAPGGWSVVGEKGPELLNLPRGSKVIPNINGAMQLSGQFKIAGRDLYLVLNRYSRELGTNT